MITRPPPPSAAIVLVLVGAIMMATGCLSGTVDQNGTGNLSRDNSDETGLPVTMNPPIPREKYIFIEHSVNTNGEMISEKCCGGPVFGNPPGHLFRKGVLKLRDYYRNGTNESMILFYGGWGGLSGCAGMGSNGWGFPVYSLPFTPSWPKVERNVTIESISGDGTVSLRYNQEPISLKPNETWSLNSTRYETNTWNSTGESGVTVRKSCTYKLVTTDRFYNAGILGKDTIVFYPGVIT